MIVVITNYMRSSVDSFMVIIDIYLQIATIILNVIKLRITPMHKMGRSLPDVKLLIIDDQDLACVRALHADGVPR